MRAERQLCRRQKSLFAVLRSCLKMTQCNFEIRWQKKQIASLLFRTLNRRVFQLAQVMQVKESS
jgi:hypothetical protein